MNKIINYISLNFFKAVFAVLAILPSFATAQNQAQNYFLQNDISNPVDEYYIKHYDKRFHSSLKPYLYTTLDSLKDEEFKFRHFAVHRYNFRKEFYEDQTQKTRVALQILPQLDIQQGYDFLDKKMLNETSGGVYIRADVNEKFSAAINCVGGIVRYPGFMDTIVQSYGIIPGMGMAYRQGRSDSSGYNPFSKYAFSNLTGYISWSPRKFINFQLGKDKQFIGDGYRSLLLSDMANNYPFFKTTVNIWHLQYSSWYSMFTDVTTANGMKAGYKTKFGTFHYLSWNATKNLNISAFENIIWQGNDTNRARGFDPNYLNPVIFYRPVEYSLGSSDNAMLGLNVSLKIAKSLKLYGQLVLDEFYLKEIRAQRGWWANKQGFQLGAKYIDAFTIKKLTLQGEFNYVRPYTYSHGSPQQSYTQFNQPLAHPFGANFYEALGIAQYKHHRYRLELKGIYAVIGKDTLNKAGNIGQNIFLSYNTRPYDYGHYIGQGDKFTFIQAEIKYTYYLIPNMNLRIEAGLIQRSLQSEHGFVRQIPFVYFGIKTSLYNMYRDF